MTSAMEMRTSSLVLPSSGYELDREEMSYVEGGTELFRFPSWMASGILGAITGGTVLAAAIKMKFFVAMPVTATALALVAGYYSSSFMSALRQSAATGRDVVVHSNWWAMLTGGVLGLIVAGMTGSIDLGLGTFVTANAWTISFEV